MFTAGTYKRRARALTEAVAEMFPKLKVTTSTRRQCFNVVLNGVTIWDGRSMGPPRRHKFEILEGTKLYDVVTAAAAAKKKKQKK